MTRRRQYITALADMLAAKNKHTRRCSR